MLRNLNQSYSRGRICGTWHSGTLGSDIPSTGDDGVPPLYNDISLPADNDKEYRLYITSWPVALDLFVYEDSSFTASGQDGTYVIPYDLYENGVNIGSSTFTITFGSGGGAGVGAIIEGGGGGGASESSRKTGFKNPSMYKWLEFDMMSNMSYFEEAAKKKEDEKKKDNKEEKVKKISNEVIEKKVLEAKNSSVLSKEQAEMLKKLTGVPKFDMKIANNSIGKRVNLFMDMYKQSALPKEDLNKISSNKRAGLSDEVAVLLYLLSKK